MEDRRTESYSILVKMKVPDYLKLVENAYKAKGGITGQRDRLKTTSAIRIRKRMVEDFNRGAILPPVVVGILAGDEEFKELGIGSEKRVRELLERLPAERISIIDGMQRTAVFFENKDQYQHREIRVEMWVATDTSHLTYRMLVLNTGQVPWNLRRQIEVMYAPIITEIRSKMQAASAELSRPIDIFSIDDRKRRTQPGEFQADDVMEMYMAFALRKAKVDTETVLANEFSRLDMIDAVSRDNFLPLFIQVFTALCKLDLAFGRLTTNSSEGKFSIGRHLFDSQPACVGFVTAAAQRIFGRPGTTGKDHTEQARAARDIMKRCTEVSERISTMDPEQIAMFLDFDVLNEAVTRPSGKIGDFEREFFTEAFRVFFAEEEPIQSMTSCWRAY